MKDKGDGEDFKNYLDDAELRRLLHQGHVQRAWIKKEPDKSFATRLDR